MNRLAIETATEACSVALVAGERCIERSETAPRIHARVLVPWVESLLSEAGLDYADLESVAVDRGPGGFTSLRLGLGVAQGIALAHALPAHPVSSLAALAQVARRSSKADRILAAMDARMGEIYAGWFEFDGNRPRQVGDEWLGAPSELHDRCDGPFHGAGSAFAQYDEVLRERLGERLASVDASAAPTATAVATLADGVEPVEAHRLEPVYLRDRVTG